MRWLDKANMFNKNWRRIQLDEQYYEAMLRNHQRGRHDAEASWDDRAKSFGLEQKRNGMDNSSVFSLSISLILIDVVGS